MPFDKTRKALGMDDENDSSPTYQEKDLPDDMSTDEDNDVAGQPDARARALGLNTLTPAPSKAYSKPVQNPFSEEGIAQGDEEARARKDRLSSVVGNPSSDDYLAALFGGTKSNEENMNDAANMAMAGMGSIKSFGKIGPGSTSLVKNAAQQLRDARAGGEAGLVQIPTMGEKYEAAMAAQKASQPAAPAGPSVQDAIARARELYGPDLAKQKPYLTPDQYSAMWRARIEKAMQDLKAEHANNPMDRLAPKE